MSEAALILAVSTFCKFSNMKIDKEVKITCMEQQINCIIVEDGKMKKELVKKCQDKWLKLETK